MSMRQRISIRHAIQIQTVGVGVHNYNYLVTCEFNQRCFPSYYVLVLLRVRPTTWWVGDRDNDKR
jgi:hypothetical protein